jgi:hypothetical protein
MVLSNSCAEALHGLPTHTEFVVSKTDPHKHVSFTKERVGQVSSLFQSPVRIRPAKQTTFWKIQIYKSVSMICHEFRNRQ